MINTFETDRGVSGMDDRKILIKDFADHWRGKGYEKVIHNNSGYKLSTVSDTIDANECSFLFRIKAQ